MEIMVEPGGALVKGIYKKSLGELKIFIMALLSAIALIGEAVLPTSEAVVKLTGGSVNPLLCFIAKLRIVMPDKGILGLVIFLGLWLLYKYNFKCREKQRFSAPFFVLSLIFAFIMLTGMSFKKFNSFAFVFDSKFQMVYSTILFCGFLCIFYTLFEACLRQVEKREIKWEENSVWTLILDRHPFVNSFCFLIVFWLPYWIAFFPGSAMWDAFRQFNYFFGVEPWSTHHPVFSTLIYGGLMQLGRMIYSDNMGLFLCALFQHFLFGGSIAYGMYRLKAWGTPQRIRIWILIFFALCPFVAFWPHSVMKDVAFDAFILIFSIFLIDLVHTLRCGTTSTGQLLGTILFGVLASLMRHNGIYIVFLSLALLACIKGIFKTKVKIVFCALLVLVGVKAISNTLMVTVGAQKGSSGLALSVPFQQTARYVKEYGNEVTEEEREAINAVLNYDYLAEHYDPDLSDPIKGTYKNDDTKLSAYLKVWFQMFWKHPMTYIEATVSNSYSYFYPNGESTTKPLVYDSITYDSRINNGYLDLHYTNPHSGIRNLFDGMLYVVKKTPGIGLTCHMGTYTWLLFILITVGIHKRKGYLILGCTPALLNFLSCVASPVNGYLRYFLPNVLIVPILIGWFAVELTSTQNEK